MGAVQFNNDNDYRAAMSALEYKYGKPNLSHGYIWWANSESEIKSPFQSSFIMFTSTHYIINIKPYIEKRKQDEQYNKYFN